MHLVTNSTNCTMHVVYFYFIIITLAKLYNSCATNIKLDVQNRGKMFKRTETLSNVINSTFLGYKCVHIFAENDKLVDTNVLYNSNLFLFKRIKFDKYFNNSSLNNDKYCGGFVWIGANAKYMIEEIATRKINFNYVPRILFAVFGDGEMLTTSNLTEKYSEFFEDKESVILQASDRNNSLATTIYQKLRNNNDWITISYRKKFELFRSILLPHLLQNYNGRTARIVTFNCPIFGSIKLTRGKYEMLDGVETRMIKEILKLLNLKAEISVPQGGVRWGTLQNGTYNGGIMKYLKDKSHDIGFCSLWNEASKHPHINLSSYWSAICVRFLLPKPKPLRIYWDSIFRPLHPHLWILIILSSSIVTFLHWFIWIAQIQVNANFRGKTRWKNLSGSLVNVIGTLVLAYSPRYNHTPSSCSVRSLLAWWSIFALVATTSYSSSLVSRLTYPRYEQMPQTIKDLLDGGFYWGLPYAMPLKYFVWEKDPSYAEFMRRFKLEKDGDGVEKRILRGNYAVLTKCIGRNHFMEVERIPVALLHELRSVRRCINDRYYYVSLGFRKGLPYFEEADKIVGCAVESGLIEYWMTRLFDKLYPPSTFSKVYEYKNPTNDNGPTVITFDQLQGAFYLLIIGYVLSFALLMLEMNDG